MPEDEEKVEEVVETTEEVKEPIPEPQPKTYSKEDVKAQLKEQYDTLNKELSRKGAEIKRLREQAGQPPAYPTDTLKEVAEELGRLGGEYGDAGSASRIQALTARLEQEKANQAREQVTRQKRDELVSKIEEAGLDPTSDEFEATWDAFDFGYYVGPAQFDKAFTKADKVIAKQKAQAPEKKAEGKETLEELRAKVASLEAEQNRKKAEDEGLLVSETAGPSAVSGSAQQVLDDAVEGKISWTEAKKKGAKFI